MMYDINVNVNVTTYCPNTENTTARPKAWSTGNPDLTAKIIATIEPNTAFGGCAPPTGMLPTIISSYVPPMTRPVFISPKIKPIIGQAIIGRYKSSVSENWSIAKMNVATASNNACKII